VAAWGAWHKLTCWQCLKKLRVMLFWEVAWKQANLYKRWAYVHDACHTEAGCAICGSIEKLSTVRQDYNKRLRSQHEEEIAAQ